MENNALTPQQKKHSARWTWRLLIAWCMASLIALVVALAIMKIDRSRTDQAARLNLQNLWPFWLASAAGWLGLTVMWRRLHCCQAQGTALQGDGRSFRRAAMFIMLVAFAVRVAVLILHDPALSDDVYRYIFEGRKFAAGFNPYLVKAADRLDAPWENFKGERLLIDTPPEVSATRLVTYGSVATPYLPVSHLTFGALGWIIGMNDRWSDPFSSARVFRICFTCVELATIILLFAACRRAGRSAWWTALYAWHPLPISEIAGSGHQDILGIALLVGGLLAWSINSRKTVIWAALLTLSMLVKPIAAAAGAMIVRRTPRSELLRTAARAGIVAAPLAAILLAIFWLAPRGGAQGFQNWRETVSLLSQKWAHFGGLYEFVLSIAHHVLPDEGKPAGYNMVQEMAARRVCVLVLLVACGLIFWKGRDVWRGTAAMLLAVVLCTTTANPWYLLWAFALFPMANLSSLWVLSLTLPWGYAVFTTLGRPDWPWIPTWVYIIAYGPAFAAVAFDVMKRWRSRGVHVSAAPHAAGIAP